MRRWLILSLGIGLSGCSKAPHVKPLTADDLMMASHRLELACSPESPEMLVVVDGTPQESPDGVAAFLTPWGGFRPWHPIYVNLCTVSLGWVTR